MSKDNCNCGHDHDDEFEVITISLDNGEEIACNVVGVFEVDAKSYIALAPVDDDEIIIYGFNEMENGDVELLDIESDEEFERVSEAMGELFDEVEFEELDDEDFDDEDFEEEESDDEDSEANFPTNSN